MARSANRTAKPTATAAPTATPAVLKPAAKPQKGSATGSGLAAPAAMPLPVVQALTDLPPLPLVGLQAQTSSRSSLWRVGAILAKDTLNTLYHSLTSHLVRALQDIVYGYATGRG
jgi:hypothetical protein